MAQNHPARMRVGVLGLCVCFAPAADGTLAGLSFNSFTMNQARLVQQLHHIYSPAAVPEQHDVRLWPVDRIVLPAA